MSVDRDGLDYGEPDEPVCASCGCDATYATLVTEQEPSTRLAPIRCNDPVTICLLCRATGARRALFDHPSHFTSDTKQILKAICVIGNMALAALKHAADE